MSTNHLLMRYLLIASILLVYGCTMDKENDPVKIALQSQSPEIKTVVDNIEQYEIQVKLTTVSRSEDSTIFTDYQFQVDDNFYHYPASTVKFPLSVLILEKLNRDGKYTIDTPFYVEGDSSATTFRHEIQDIFAVSSNETYNRLFEYYGKDNINEAFKQKGLQPVRYSHRLSTSDAENLATKPVIFLNKDLIAETTQPIINQPIKKLDLNNTLKGVGYYKNDSLNNEPFDFSVKNYLPISTNHEIMKRVIYPEIYPKNKQFDLIESDRAFLLNAMSMYPKDAGYTSDPYYDSYGKFFIYGDSKDPIPDYIKIYNKVGYAYGFLTDCAYIKDTKHDIEYILTATIHVNKNGIFNDDNYEYDNIGIPFLAQLGREIHAQLIN